MTEMGQPRVMLGNLGPIARVGMRRLLSEGGVDVLDAELAAAPVDPVMARLQPDVVVLDLDRTDSQRLSKVVRRTCPQAKVVLWAANEDVMEVIDPGATRPRWVLSGVPRDLLAEMRTPTRTRAKE